MTNTRFTVTFEEMDRAMNMPDADGTWPETWVAMNRELAKRPVDYVAQGLANLHAAWTVLTPDEQHAIVAQLYEPPVERLWFQLAKLLKALDLHGSGVPVVTIPGNTPVTPPTPPAAEDDLDYDAWCLLANVGGGDWTTQAEEWQDAAARWRLRFHGKLGGGTPFQRRPELPSTAESVVVFDANPLPVDIKVTVTNVEGPSQRMGLLAVDGTFTPEPHPRPSIAVAASLSVDRAADAGYAKSSRDVYAYLARLKSQLPDAPVWRGRLDKLMEDIARDKHVGASDP